MAFVFAEWEVRHVSKDCARAVQSHDSSTHRQGMTGSAADVAVRSGDVKTNSNASRHKIGDTASFQRQWEECTMAVTRRKVLKGGTALAGGMAAILASGRAPRLSPA